jgi:predicted adenylyl cyclase CyaB
VTVEVELRSFITKEKHDELIGFFKKNGEFINEDYQESYYFDDKGDVRIQKNKFFSKVWIKKGNLHDEQREEMEVKFSRDDFEKLEKTMEILGLTVKIKWLRKRHSFNWQGVGAMVDYTKGYGYILELEKMSDVQNKDKDLQTLREKFRSLGIEPTPRKEFDKKYAKYKENWRTLINE